jgi:hypothetical protein
MPENVVLKFILTFYEIMICKNRNFGVFTRRYCVYILPSVLDMFLYKHYRSCPHFEQAFSAERLLTVFHMQILQIVFDFQTIFNLFVSETLHKYPLSFPFCKDIFFLVFVKDQYHVKVTAFSPDPHCCGQD